MYGPDEMDGMPVQPTAPRQADSHNPAAIAFAKRRLMQLKRMVPGLQLPQGGDVTAQWRQVSPLMGLIRSRGGGDPRAAQPLMDNTLADEAMGTPHDPAAMARQALRQLLQSRQAPAIGHQPSQALQTAARLAAARHMQHAGY